MAAIHREFRYDGTATVVETTAAQAFTSGAACARILPM
jgi:hypothetical protein